MQAVFNSPMSAVQPGKPVHVRRQAADEVPNFFCFLSLLNRLATNTHDALSVGPMATDGKRCCHGSVATLFLTPVVLFACRHTRTWRGRASAPEFKLDNLLQVLLILFHCQHVVASLITHLAGNRFLTTDGIDR